MNRVLASKMQQPCRVWRAAEEYRDRHSRMTAGLAGPEPVGAGPGMRIVRVVLYLAAVNGAAAKLTLKRLHQMETTLYLLRSTLSGTS